MVSPNDTWEETEHGYENGDTSVIVSEVEGRIINDGQRKSFTGYEVQIWEGPAGYASPTEIATYEEPRPAWELANLLTRLYGTYPANLLMGLEGPEGDSLPRGLADRDPAQLLRDVLGYEASYVDEALGDD
ncbi:hypothetical protein [Halorussus pelagicus]|uniref:hypothetical protein n=1 Tax=Halorussus pelagicus TaxID=2505977 RepID=UPI000FFC88C6|nr:hypothetical protein [Halorussus pelagicus]